MTVSRILLVSKGLDIGGIERMVVDLANALARSGVDVHVAVVNDRRDGLIGQLERSGITLHRLGGSDLIGFRAAARLARLVRDSRFDVVHVHGPLPSIVARLVPGKRPLVTTSHTPMSALRRPTRALWLLTSRADNATIAVSAVVATSMPRLVAADVIVIPHGLDMDAIRRVRVAAKASQREPGEVVGITVASHRDAKNYPNLLHALQVALDRGVPLRLIAIGDGPDLQHHRALARQLGIDGSITFVPPDPDILGLIASADFLVVASDYEGQPLVVMEALALGVPVVATAVGRVPELVNPSVGRVVPPGDPEALGGAMAELAAGPLLRSRLAVNASEHSSSWTFDDIATAHLGIYERIAHRLG